jgi:hypothetical protein
MSAADEFDPAKLNIPESRPYRIGKNKVTFAMKEGRLIATWLPCKPVWTKAQGRKFVPRYRRIRDAWLQLALPEGVKVGCITAGVNAGQFSVIEGRARQGGLN